MIIGSESLLDARPARVASDLWVGHPGVLVDFTEQVLAVDQLQPAAPIEPGEAESEASEVLLLRITHVADQLRFDSSSFGAEAFADAVPRSRSRDDEIHLIEVDQCGVVDIDDQLVGQEVAYTGMPAQ